MGSATTSTCSSRADIPSASSASWIAGRAAPLWRQIVADVLGRPIEYAPGADLGSAWGVAWVAGVAAGCWDWQRSGILGTSADPPPVVHAPVPEHTARYERQYRRYRGLYPTLRGETR